MTLETSVQYLKGVGVARAKNYEKLNIITVNDLLYHFPRYYIDLSQPVEIMSASLQELVPVKARLRSKSPEQRIRKGLSIFKLLVADDSGQMEITIFNMKYVVDRLIVDQEYLFHGKMEGTFLHRSMTSPTIYPANETFDILPVYHQTAGIQSRLIRNNVQQVLEELPQLPDPIPENFRIKYALGERNASLKNIHFPKSIEAAHIAKQRFIFEELLTLSCALHTLRSGQQQLFIQPLSPVDLTPFYQSLPYTPTNAQLRCITEATNDMLLNIPMNRLIQGDVGSGKTLVAAACIYFACKNKIQTALMVPTEILAEQHFQTLEKLLAPFYIKVELLTGSTKASKKREILENLQNGSIELCVGTHALLSDKITFANLGLVITDEQHRFGVSQRAALSQKSEHAHVLVMSATPIPRTLSLIIYGDLSLSLLDEMPPGRQEVDTLLIDSSKLQRAMGFIRKNIDAGQQAYIICPLVEMGEIDTGLRPAIEYSQQLSARELKGYSVGLLHGKMKAKEKEETMRAFKNGTIQVLVSTTVVEVGVDVPNATIIMIENAERFGLSQLHQLRGRVGRGKEKSYCILVSDAGGEVSRKRLRAMKEISDGFQLAEYDLKLRGPGDFFGYRQHGLPTLKVADLAEDVDVMVKAQECAEIILQEDPTLSSPTYQLLKKQVQKTITTVGERPN